MTSRNQQAQASLGFDASNPPSKQTRAAIRSEVTPVEPTSELEALGRALPASIVMGTSTWSFSGWAGLVYGAAYASSLLAQNGLCAYSVHPLLRGVGLDRTYYRPLSAAQAKTLANQVPDGFRFMVKAPRDLTAQYGAHRTEQPACEPLDAQWAARNFIAPLAEGMGHKLGAIVFQFSPYKRGTLGGPQAFCQQLQAFLTALPEGPLYAVEIRNRDWLIPDYVAALCETDAVHCLSIHPRLPSLHEQMRLTGPALQRGIVLRWNLGHGRAYEDAYHRYHPFDRIVDPDLLNRDQIARLCARAARAGKLCQISVNNKAEGSAPASIIALGKAIAEKVENAVDD